MNSQGNCISVIEDEVLIGGVNGVYAYRNGSWRIELSDNSSAVFSISSVGKNDVWALSSFGSASYILKYSQPENNFDYYWNVETELGNSTYFGLSSFFQDSLKKIITVGQTSRISQFNGTEWILAEQPITSRTIYSVSASNDENVWLAGSTDTFHGAMYKYNHTTKLFGQSSEALPKLLYGVTADKNSEKVWTVGQSGSGYSFDGSNWSTDLGPSFTHYRAAYSVDGSSFWVVGDNGTIFQRHGENYTSNITSHLYAIHGTSDNDIWAAGAGGTVIHYNGNNDRTFTVYDSSQTGTTNNIRGIFEVDQNNVWAVGDNCAVIHFNNGSWENVNMANICNPSTVSFKGISGADNENIWAVGSSGTIIKYNGSDWRTQYSGTTAILYSVSVVNKNSVWAAGATGTLLHYRSPINSTARQLVVALPHQKFSDGDFANKGIIEHGSLNLFRVNTPIPVSVYAVDQFYHLDMGNTYSVNFETSGNYTTDQPFLPLTQNNTCAQNRTNYSVPYCGTGSTNLTFKRPGVWDIKARDVNDILSETTSSPITVLPGIPKKTYFKSTPFSNPKTGQVLTLNIGLKDLYDNVTSPESNQTVTLKTSSGGYVSSSTNGPWSTSIDLTLLGQTHH